MMNRKIVLRFAMLVKQVGPNLVEVEVQTEQVQPFNIEYANALRDTIGIKEADDLLTSVEQKLLVAQVTAGITLQRQ